MAMAKVLIIRFSSIGDIIQCMGVVGGLINRFGPACEIHWITRKDMAGMLHLDQRIHRIWEFDKTTGLSGLLDMAKQLRKERFDYISDAHNNLRSHVLKAVLAPLPLVGPQVVTRSKERFKRFLLFKLGINRFDKPFRGMVSFRKPLRRWGVTDFQDDYTDWAFPAEMGQRWGALLQGEFITLVPSANWQMKRWPVRHWQELVRKMPDKRFIVLGGPKDTFCAEIASVAPQRVTNLAGQTSLMESCYIVAHSRLVVSADTGFLHAADLFHIPALALMGPTAFGFPTGESVKVLELPLPCRPCTKDGRGGCKLPEWAHCMSGITPQWVADEAGRFMDKG